MQQAAAGQVVRLAQVQVVVPGRRLGPQPQVALLVLQVPLQRHHGGRGRHRAEPLADHEPPLDERDEQVAALAQHRAGRLGDLFQAGQRPSAQRGERLGQPDRLDDVRRRRRDALVAQDGGGLGQPPLDGLARGGEQVVVPAGRADAGPVARGVGQPPVGPGHPGQGGLHLRQAAQQPVVGGGGWQVPQGRHVPGAADHRDPLEAVPDRPAQYLPHVRLADRVPRVGFSGVGAEDRDGFGQRVEDGGSRDVLHHVLPPALRVVVPGRGGQLADGIGAPPSAAFPRPSASWCAAGRSQNRTGTPASSAYLIACHSGENTANGQNAACLGSPGTYPSSATGGCISGSAASAASPSASGGPSIRTTSGRCSVRAARTDRADPGP